MLVQSTAETLGLDRLAVVVACGPSARAVAHRAAATHPGGKVGVLSVVGGGAATDAARDAEESLVRYQISVPANDEIPPAEIRSRIAEIARERSVSLLLIECDPEISAGAMVSLLSHVEGHDDLAELVQRPLVITAIAPSAIVDLLVRQKSDARSWSPAGVVEQIEQANTVVLEGGHAAADAPLARAIVSALNPGAVIVEGETVPARIFGLPSSAGDKPAVRDAASPGHGGAEEARTFGEGITSFAYSARRPLHPSRFFEFLKGELRGVIRAKGFFWLATKMDVVGGLVVAGAEKQAAPVGEWGAAIAEQLPDGTECPATIQSEWVEPFGDRRQALSFIGRGLDAATLRARLDACLLSDAEMAAGETNWQGMTDPFPDWSRAPHGHGCGDDCHHDHVADHHCHDDHQCCCHAH